MSNIRVGLSLPGNFSWVLPSQLAGCACPKSLEELKGLIQEGITTLVTLSPEHPPPADSIRELPQLKHVIIPVKKAPEISQLVEFTKVASQELEAGGKVAVHCRKGVGRTGTMLASYLMKNQGILADQVRFGLSSFK